MIGFRFIVFSFTGASARKDEDLVSSGLCVRDFSLLLSLD